MGIFGRLFKKKHSENNALQRSSQAQKTEVSTSEEAQAHYDLGIEFCQEYIQKGGVGDGAFVAIRRAMEEFKASLRFDRNFQTARLALADCYFALAGGFGYDPFDAAVAYHTAIEDSPNLVVDKEQASLGKQFMNQGPNSGYDAAVAYRKALKRKPVV